MIPYFEKFSIKGQKAVVEDAEGVWAIDACHTVRVQQKTCPVAAKILLGWFERGLGATVESISAWCISELYPGAMFTKGGLGFRGIISR